MPKLVQPDYKSKFNAKTKTKVHVDSVMPESWKRKELPEGDIVLCNGQKNNPKYRTRVLRMRDLYGIIFRVLRLHMFLSTNSYTCLMVTNIQKLV